VRTSVAFGEPCGILEVTGCRWPVTAVAPHLFCYARRVWGCSYCDTHEALSTGGNMIRTPSPQDRGRDSCGRKEALTVLRYAAEVVEHWSKDWASSIVPLRALPGEWLVTMEGGMEGYIDTLIVREASAIVEEIEDFLTHLERKGRPKTPEERQRLKAEFLDIQQRCNEHAQRLLQTLDRVGHA
jgi:hypothetical protein